VSVNNPKEIDEVFDKISYKKGASLIRMLHSLMGEEDFKQGIRSTGFRTVKVPS
jgi:aminopeptidase N